MSIYLGSNLVMWNKTVEVIDENLKKIVDRTIETYSNDEVENIRPYAFAHCSSLTSLNLPQARHVDNYAFAYCSSLSMMNLPQVNYVGNYAFAHCYSLTSLNLSHVTYIGDYAFYRCSSLTTVNLPQVSYIGSSAFFSCNNLFSLYLLSNSIVSLGNTDTFNYTPISTAISGIYGSIYVPSSLYSTYLTTNNWSNFSSRFVSM